MIPLVFQLIKFIFNLAIEHYFMKNSSESTYSSTFLNRLNNKIKSRKTISLRNYRRFRVRLKKCIRKWTVLEYERSSNCYKNRYDHSTGNLPLKREGRQSSISSDSSDTTSLPLGMQFIFKFAAVWKLFLKRFRNSQKYSVLLISMCSCKITVSLDSKRIFYRNADNKFIIDIQRKEKLCFAVTLKFRYSPSIGW